MKSANPATINLAFQLAATSAAAMIVVTAANVLSSIIASIGILKKSSKPDYLLGADHDFFL